MRSAREDTEQSLVFMRAMWQYWIWEGVKYVQQDIVNERCAMPDISVKRRLADVCLSFNFSKPSSVDSLVAEMIASSRPVSMLR